MCRETVIDGIFLEVEPPGDEARVILNSSRHGSIPRTLTNHLEYLPLLLLTFDLKYIYLIWCSAALRTLDSVIQVRDWF